MDLNKAINRERKKKKEQRKVKRPVPADRREDYKNKTLSIKKRRKTQQELEYEEGVSYSGGDTWIPEKPVGDGNWSRSRANR